MRRGLRTSMYNPSQVIGHQLDPQKKKRVCIHRRVTSWWCEGHWYNTYIRFYSVCLCEMLDDERKERRKKKSSVRVGFYGPTLHQGDVTRLYIYSNNTVNRVRKDIFYRVICVWPESGFSSPIRILWEDVVPRPLGLALLQIDDADL